MKSIQTFKQIHYSSISKSFLPGIDLHLKRTYMVLIDAKGEVINKGRISNQEITKYLQEKVPQETYAVLAAIHRCNF